MKLSDAESKTFSKFKGLTKTKRTFVLAACVFVVLAIILTLVFCGGRNHSALVLESACAGEVQSSIKSESLIALDSNARSGLIKESGFASFKFSKEQKDVFKKVYEQNQTVALTVRIQVMPTTKQSMLLGIPAELPFQFGFLSQDDFTKKGKFIPMEYITNRRILVSADLQHAPEYFDVSFAIQKNDDITKFIPEGFFIYSNLRIKIVAACVVPAQLGFDFGTGDFSQYSASDDFSASASASSSETPASDTSSASAYTSSSSAIPFFGFGPNGGRIDFEHKSFDFAGGTLVFPVQNTKDGTMPEYVVTMVDDAAFKSTQSDSVYSDVNIGGEKLRIKSVSQANQIIIPAASLKTPFSRLDVSVNSECIQSIILRSVKSDEYDAIRTDPGLLLKYKASAWRNSDFEVFEWDRYPGILFFDTKNYDYQGKMFTRLAFFVEKEGFKGTLLTNQELEGKHGYNAHDYSAQSMAEFFNKASAQGFELNDEEETLKKILIKNGLFELNADGVTVEPKEGGIVSISQESPDWMRTNFIAHEGWHTIFFCDEEFRNFVGAVYYTMDSSSLEFLIDYFKSQPSLGYDVNDEYLMHNEMMAYIMQQRLSEVRKYFVHLANRGSVMAYTPDLSSYIRKTEGQGFEDAAIALNDYVFDKFGIVCGNISLISR